MALMTPIAKVFDVNGKKTTAELTVSKEQILNSPELNITQMGLVGTIAKIKMAGTADVAFGFITSASLPEESTRTVQIELFGSAKKDELGQLSQFLRGVHRFPIPGEEVYIASNDELEYIFRKPGDAAFRIGTVAQDPTLPFHLLTNEFLGKHFAILGNTGSGKSCATTVVLKSVLRDHPNAHVVLIDPHNEYAQAFGREAYCVELSSLKLPHWVLNFEESCELFIDNPVSASITEKNVLKNAILSARKSFPGQSMSPDQITVDTPVPYLMSDVIRALEQDREPCKVKFISKINTLQHDRRFNFLMVPDEQVEDILESIIAEFFRFPNMGRPISIIDVSGVPSEVVNIMVAVLGRLVFDFSLWNSRRVDTPVLFVCEEAHRYAPKEESGFESAKRSLYRIAKEGRKYGVGLGLITQRPSEIAAGIISQCNTIISLRLGNDQDKQFVENVLPESVNSLTNALSSLRPREGLVVGESTAIPARVSFDYLPEDERPRSETTPFAQSWSESKGDEKSIVNAAVSKWRRQERNIPIELRI